MQPRTSTWLVAPPGDVRPSMATTEVPMTPLSRSMNTLVFGGLGGGTMMIALLELMYARFQHLGVMDPHLPALVFSAIAAVALVMGIASLNQIKAAREAKHNDDLDKLDPMLVVIFPIGFLVAGAVLVLGPGYGLL